MNRGLFGALIAARTAALSAVLWAIVTVSGGACATPSVTNAYSISEAPAVVAQEVPADHDIVDVRVQLVFTTLALSFGFLFLVLFFFLPRDHAYLYFALMMITLGAAIFFDFQDQFSDGDLYIRLQRAFICVGLVFGLRFVYALFLPKPPRLYSVVVLGFVIAGALAMLDPRANMRYVMVMILVMWFESLRVLVGAIRQRVRGAWTITAGFVVFFVAGVYDLLLDGNVIDPIYGVTNGYQFGFLGLCLGSAIYLAQGVSQSNEKIVAQEITLREQAVERRLLDAEIAHKTKELEDARALQLSMLPSELPVHTRYRLAAYMNPASEVGGDYYDFDVDPEGVLTVAIGDATGHGLKAGIMVAIAKSLFVGLTSREDIRGFFSRCTRLLKQMNLGNLFMGLAVLRFERETLKISSAGMPPVLIYRSAQSSVEPVVLKGMPLGAFDGFPYQEYETVLASDDVVLLMSDGLTELFNPAREMFGDAGAVDAFLKAARGAPQEILEELVAAADSWRDGHPQEDDITFVVVRHVEKAQEPQS